MDSTKFDDLLMGILQHCEQVEPFLDAIFSFLARRTDFFQVMHNRDDKMGFPPGVAEKMVLKMFKTYQQIVAGSQARTKKQAHGNMSEKKKPKCRDSETSTDNTASCENMSPSVPMCTASPGTVVPPAVTSCEVETSAGITETTPSPKPTSSSQPNEDIKSNESKGLVPGKTADCYNGAVLDNYSWSQTISDVEVRIPVPSSVTKGRDVGVEIKSSHLKVWLKKGIPPDSGTVSVARGSAKEETSGKNHQPWTMRHSGNKGNNSL